MTAKALADSFGSDTSTYSISVGKVVASVLAQAYANAIASVDC